MESTPLYRQVAGHYRRAIESGTLTAGDRMPSVRALMGLHGVSLSTALQACRQLESDGLLEARPRAGYFVSAPLRAPLAPLTEPDAALPDPAQYVGIHQRISGLLARSQHQHVHTNLGGAYCAPSLYPADALFGFPAIEALIARRPELLATNSSVAQKAYAGSPDAKRG